MKKWLCVLCCLALVLPVLSCAAGEESGELFTIARGDIALIRQAIDF